MGRWLTKTFYWHSSWLYLLISFPGVLIYAIVAVVVRKKVRLSVPLCETHRAARTRMKWLATALLLGFIPVGALLPQLGVSVAWSVLIMLAMIAGGVVASIVTSLLRPTYIGDQYARFRGASEQFMSLLPSGAATSATAGRK